MNMIGQPFDVGEFFVGEQLSFFGAPAGLPAVVDVDITPSVFDQSVAHHGVGGSFYLILVYRACPVVPAVPSHGRRQRQLVGANDDFQAPGSFPRFVPGSDVDCIFPFLFHFPGDQSGGGVH